MTIKDKRKSSDITEALMNLLNSSAQEGMQYVTFLIGEEEYAIAISLVQEITALKPLTPLPNTQDFVRGILNLRGNVIPVMDLRAIFGLPPTEFSKHTVIIIFNNNEKKIGLIVDQISDVITIDKSNIEDTPDVALSINTSFIDGIGKIGDRFIIMLNLSTVFSTQLKDTHV